VSTPDPFGDALSTQAQSAGSGDAFGSALDAHAAGDDIDQTQPPSWLATNVLNPLGRAAAKAVTGLPLMAEDFGVAARNVIEGKDKAGNYPYELPSTTVNRAIDRAMPPPTSTVGKVSELANTMIMGGALPGASVKSSVPSNFVSPDQAPVSGLTGAQQKAADAGKALGMRMTPGQETGSQTLQQLEARLQSMPSTSGPFNAVSAGNQGVLNATGAAAIGESGASVDANVLGAANDRMGQIFESVRDPSKVVQMEPTTTSRVIDAIDADKAGLLPGSGSVRDNKLVENFEKLAQSGAMTGEQLGNLSSKLGKAAYKQMSSQQGDRDLGEALYQVKNHADDLLESTLEGDAKAEYSAVRGQYRTLMQLSKSGVVNPSSGNISGATLANRLQSSDRSGYLYGNNQSDLYNGARFAQAFKPIVGDSGTATRSMNLKDMALAIPGNVASWAYLHPLAPTVRALANTPGGIQKILDKGISPEMLSAIITGTATGEHQLNSDPAPNE